MTKKRTLAVLGAAAVVAVGIFLWHWQSGRATPVPVLMYHHFIAEGEATTDTVVTAQRFEEQLQALSDGGYTSVTPQQLIDYVDLGTPLPDKPVLITMDDGYTSNLTVAAPLLEQYGFTAVVFVIGVNVGETVYVHSGQTLSPPRFSWEEVRPWVDKGVLVVQSHTYDMHQRESYGFSGRDGVLPLAGESEEDYRAALYEDFTKAKEGLREGLGVELTAVAFPFGFSSDEAVETLEALGVRMSFTTQYGVSLVSAGHRESLQRMDRWWIGEEISGTALTQRLDELCKQANHPIIQKILRKAGLSS